LRALADMSFLDDEEKKALGFLSKVERRVGGEER
jgi:hypothetical protein